MKILLFGCNGQLGWELQRSLAPLGALEPLDIDSTVHAADFSHPEELASTVRAVAPQVIVNAAAHTAVDRAEAEPDIAEAINALAPGVLAREAAALGAWLVHYSTDYVFDGSGSLARSEDAPTGPLNVYGRTKLAGETAVRASGCKHLMFRTSWIYAPRGVNFARTILKRAAEREHLTVIDDQVGAPTGADLLADVTAHALRATLRQPELGGTYHATASGETSWHGYATLVIDWARQRQLPLKVNRDNGVQAVPTSAFPTAARRPLNSRLDTTRLQRAFDLTMPHWRDGVLRMLAEAHGG